VPAHAKGNFMEIIFNGGYGKEGAAERQEALAAEERKSGRRDFQLRDGPLEGLAEIRFCQPGGLVPWLVIN
jgi:hypothetical protein